jgi:hypothetical protein
MNDWHLDPPEEPEPPSCHKCKDLMDPAEDGLSCTCATCGFSICFEPDDPEPPDPWIPDDQ